MGEGINTKCPFQKANAPQFISAYLCAIQYVTTGEKDPHNFDIYEDPNDENSPEYVFVSTEVVKSGSYYGREAGWFVHTKGLLGEDIYTSTETGEEYSFEEIATGKKKIAAAGVPIGALRKILSGLLVKSASLKQIYKLRLKGILKIDKKTGLVVVSTSATTGSLALNLLSNVSKSIMDKVRLILELQGIALFTDFICEEAVQSAGMALFIAKGRDIKTLEESLNTYKKIYNMAISIHHYAQFNIAKQAFDAFFLSAEENIKVYEVMFNDAKAAAALRGETEDAGKVTIYTKGKYLITLDGLQKKYSPRILSVNPGNHVIELSGKDKEKYTETFTLDKYGLKDIGTEENPIVLKDATKCTNVIDGDTIVVNYKEHIRFIGINAPESYSSYGKAAKNWLKKLCESKEVRLEIDSVYNDKDVYKRLLRWVFVDNTNLNVEAIKTGHAIPMGETEKYKDEIIAADKYAKDNNLQHAPSELFVPERHKGEIRIYTTEKYTILKDGLSAGTSPKTIKKLAVGSYTIILSKKKRKSQTFEIALGANEVKNIGSEESPITLETEESPKTKEKNKGEIRIYTTEKYTITVDGLSAGTSPKIIKKLAAGSYTIILKKKKRKSQTFEIAVGVNEIKNIGSEESPITLETE